MSRIAAIAAAIVAGLSWPEGNRAEPRPTPRIERCPDAERGLSFYRSRIARHRFRLARGSFLPQPDPGRVPRDCARVRRHAVAYRARARLLRRVYEAWLDETYARWACIHRHEGAWNDAGAPHWGGLQMDMAFQLAYGSEYVRRWGTADKWPVWAQLRAAERARAVRGFQPWPNTARACGLL